MSTPAWRQPADESVWEILPGRLWQAASPFHWDVLADLGIDTLVDLNGDGDRRPEPVGWHPSESILYVFWPLSDGRLPDVENLGSLTDLIVRRLARGHRALVLCSQGLNRSGLVSSLVVRAVQGGSGRDALGHVDERRGRPMSNTTFAAHLRSLPEPGPVSGGAG